MDSKQKVFYTVLILAILLVFIVFPIYMLKIQMQADCYKEGSGRAVGSKGGRGRERKRVVHSGRISEPRDMIESTNIPNSPPVCTYSDSAPPRVYNSSASPTVTTTPNNRTFGLPNSQARVAVDSPVIVSGLIYRNENESLDDVWNRIHGVTPPVTTASTAHYSNFPWDQPKDHEVETEVESIDDCIYLISTPVEIPSSATVSSTFWDQPNTSNGLNSDSEIEDRATVTNIVESEPDLHIDSSNRIVGYSHDFEDISVTSILNIPVTSTSGFPAFDTSDFVADGKRAKISPADIAASYVKPVSSAVKAREVDAGSSTFSLLFKGINNFSLIPEKHRHHLALVLTVAEIVDSASRAILETVTNGGIMLILQLDGDERESIIRENEFLNYYTDQIMPFYGLNYKFKYFMLPNDGDESRNEIIKALFNPNVVKFVTPHATITATSSLSVFTEAVVVDISGSDAEAVIQNLDVQLESTGNTEYPVCDFINIWNTQVQITDIKSINNFRNNLPRYLNEKFYMYIGRDTVLKDSFESLKSNNFTNFRSFKFSIKFNEEPGVDLGGLLREWYSVLTKELLNPDNELFRASAINQSVYFPNPQSFKKKHLELFEFAGMFVARAVIDKTTINCHFSQVFYKHILGIKPDFEDLKEIDLDTYTQLSTISESKELEDWMQEIAFEIVVIDAYETQTFELKPGGSEIFLNLENREEYIALYANFKMIFEVEQQMKAFMKGFNFLIPADKIVDQLGIKELDVLIAGVQKLDIEDWKRNTDYQRYNEYSDQIIWFWDLIGRLDDKGRRQILRLATGSESVPIEGFAGLRDKDGPRKFGLHKVYDRNRYPLGHTCFNYIDLPDYLTKEDFEQKMGEVLHEGNMAFGSK